MRRFASEYSAAHEARDRALFREAFACMDASDETIEKVMEMAWQLEDAEKRAARARGAHAAGSAGTVGGTPASGHGRGRRRGLGRGQRGRITVRAALATAAATALIASGAYAAVSADFFQTAFGPKGNPDVEARIVVEEGNVNPQTGEQKSWVAPARTWEAVDDQTALRLLGAYVADVYESIEVNGYTLTVEQCVMDENGNGVATFSLENPDGLELWDAGYGVVTLSNSAPVFMHACGIESADGTGATGVALMWDCYSVADAAASTGTALKGAFYFGPFAGEIGNGIRWILEDRTAQQGSADNATASIAYMPEATVPVQGFVAQTGDLLELSPLGLVADCPAAAEGSMTASAMDIAVRFKDGSEYIVSRQDAEAPVLNAITRYQITDGSATGCVFNQLVDVDEVESVCVAWNYSMNGEWPSTVELVYTAR